MSAQQPLCCANSLLVQSVGSLSPCVHRGMLTKVTPSTGKLPGTGSRGRLVSRGTWSSGSAAGSFASRQTQTVEYRVLLTLKQGTYQESRIRPIPSGAQHIWLMQGIASCHVAAMVQRVKVLIKTAIKRFSANIT